MLQTTGLFLLLHIVGTVASPLDTSETEYDAWRLRYSKSDDDNATLRSRRYSAWKDNFKIVTAHNAQFQAGLTTYTMAMNMHADLTNQEYRALRLRPRHSRQRPTAALGTILARAADDAPSPTSKDWIAQGVIVGIKDQGQCGSCWGFSAVATMEGTYNLHQQTMTSGSPSKVCNSTCGPKNIPCCSFSEQEVVDCTREGQDTCTTGGEMHDGVMEVVTRHGEISTEANYPYVSGKTKELTKCQPQGTPVNTGITGYKNITSGSETALLQASVTHPVISVGIDASSLGFQLYSSGIYVDEEGCGNNMTSIDHGVAVVGFGSGKFAPPGPLPPLPGPNDCDHNFKKDGCISVKGCHWCPDQPVGYCSPVVCPSMDAASNESADKDCTCFSLNFFFDFLFYFYKIFTRFLTTHFSLHSLRLDRQEQLGRRVGTWWLHRNGKKSPKYVWNCNRRHCCCYVEQNVATSMHTVSLD